LTRRSFIAPPSPFLSLKVFDSYLAYKGVPVLEAAHIKPYSLGGPHKPENGLLLRSDLHTLFDQGYLTVGADDLRVMISNRIREEFENGRDYYHLHGRAVRVPRETDCVPSREYLSFHNNVFR
jgi:putative restriction endonuclease